MSALILSIAMLLDALLGEPRWLWNRAPHPAVLMGRLVRQLDTALNRDQVWQGTLALALLIFFGALIGTVLSFGGALVEVIVVAILLAQRALVQHVAAVGDGLRMSTAEGRRMVARIVSRDVRQADDSAIARAAIESAAENLSDGVIAPAFWFLIGGLPGIMVYKMVNTGDSMIGYRTAQYENFGKATARMDDLMNWIPARLTAIAIALIHGKLGAYRAIVADARRHRSPNAGWPEAALARALGIALAGPRSYDGRTEELEWVGAGGQKELSPNDIDAACGVLWQVWGLFLALLIVILILG